MAKVFSNKNSIYTLCPSAPVKYAPVASPVDEVGEIACNVPNDTFPANRYISFLPWS